HGGRGAAGTAVRDGAGGDRVLARVARLAAARALGGTRATGRRQRPRTPEWLTRSVVETARRALLLGRCVLRRRPGAVALVVAPDIHRRLHSRGESRSAGRDRHRVAGMGRASAAAISPCDRLGP